MSDDTIQISVTVAGRVYRLRVGMDEEAFVRRGAEMIEERINQLRNSYSVNDDKDLIAMAALQTGTELARNDKEGVQERSENEKRFQELEQRVATYLKEKGQE